MSIQRPLVFILSALIFGMSGTALVSEELDYHVDDSRLKVVRLDSAETESFISLCADTAGRLFVGAREELYRYEPDGQGGFKPRVTLYRFPDHSWVYDVEVRGEDVYAVTTTALYILRGAVRRHENLVPERLVWGIPLGHVHQCFHALEWGPEGDLYVSTGDPIPRYGDIERPDHWAYWTYFCQPEGTRIPYHGVGCVFRCRPDGSRFQLVTEGNRNSCGLAFNRDFDLFTNDNDHESMPSEYVPARLIHAAPRSHFLWPRGWMLENQPDRADILETLYPGMKRSVPVHMTYYDSPFLPGEYRNNLFVARWGIRTVTRYELRRQGATIKSDEEKSLLLGQNLARPLGVCVGPRGRVYVTICYMAHNEGSPVYRSDLVMLTRADAPAGADYEPYEASTASAARLWEELSTEDWKRRHRAHVELQRRGGALLEDAVGRLGAAEKSSRAFIHLLWLAASSGTRRANESLIALAADSDVDVRTQAIRALGEFDGPRGVFARALSDPEPRVQHAATVAFHELGGPFPEGLVQRSARSPDSFIRQAATRLLARYASVAELRELCESKDTRTRMAGVLAAGFRLTMPPTHEPLDPALPLDPYRGEEPYVIPYADATVDLRDFGPAGMYLFATHWKLRKHELWEKELFALLQHMLDDSDELVRLQTANFLAPLNDSRSNPAVARVRKASAELRLADAPIGQVNKIWVAGPFADKGESFDRVHDPEKGPVDLGATYSDSGREIDWTQMGRTAHFDFLKNDHLMRFGSLDDSSIYAFLRLESARRQRIFLLVGSGDGFKLWHNGSQVFEIRVDRGVLPFQDVVSLELDAGGNDLLFRVQNNTGSTGLFLHTRALHKTVVTLPEKVSLSALAERIRSGAEGEVELDPEFFETDWNKAVARGDLEEGRKLFESLACNRCHAVSPEAATTGGPSLVDAKKRFTVPYLVESVLSPNKQVSPIFRGLLVLTVDGDAVPGLILNETSDEIEMLLRDGMRKKIAKSNILERRQLETSPMPAGLGKTPEELMHLLAYLTSQ